VERCELEHRGRSRQDCASADFCVVTSHTSHATPVWNGSKWSALAGFPLGAQANVSCGRAGSCVAVGNSGAAAVLS
jgi:hypothetical protein